MDRATIQSQIDAMYAARAANDPGAALKCFAADAEIRFAGSPDASSFATNVKGEKAVADLLEEMIGVWQWQGFQPHSTVIDGHSAGVRYTIDTLHVPSGGRIQTEIMDHVEFDDVGRIRLFVSFVDTAMVGVLAGEAVADA